MWFSSPDVPSAAKLGVAALLWSSALPFFSDRLVAVARSAWQAERIASVDPFRALEATTREALEAVAAMVAIVMIAMFCVAGLLQFLQIGPVFTVKRMWEPTKLNPAKGFQNIFFKGETYKKAVIDLIKAALMLGLAVSTVWRLAPNIFLSSRIGVDQTVKLFNTGFSSFLFQAALLSMVFAGADYMIKRVQFFKDQRMTDEELKKDQKEEQGDPEVKARMRHMAQARLRAGRH
jgi:flagellar biosynthesis protein FlhB